MNNDKYYLNVNGEAVEVSFEVYKLFHTYRRKELYFMKERKEDRQRVDPITHEIIYIPSLEDSYDRIVEVYGDIFAGKTQMPEEIILQKEEMKNLYQALDSLEENERALIQDLFFSGRTEKEIAYKRKLSIKTINYHKHRIFAKLKKYLSC